MAREVEYHNSMFLGPNGENKGTLLELLVEVLWNHVERRKHFHDKNGDGPFIPEQDRANKAYQAQLGKLRTATQELMTRLAESVPWFSPRYMAHMNSDVLMPAIIGYFATMLYNPNNVVVESSPATSQMEVEAIDELLALMGFTPRSKRQPGQVAGWGHFTSGGHLANFGALWVARNLKYFPLALQRGADIGVNIDIRLPNGQTRHLFQWLPEDDEAAFEQDRWELLNLRYEEALSLRSRLIARMKEAYFNNELSWLPLAATEEQRRVDMRTIQRRVDETFIRERGVSAQGLWGLWAGRPGVILAPGTAHYSILKAAEVLGIGRRQMIKVPVDVHFRMDVCELRNILRGLARKRIPVIAVVAVFGSTEEAAIDPLHEILEVREEFAQKGLYFPVHVDAAYGGYARTMFIDSEGKMLSRHQVMQAVGYNYPPREVYEAQAAIPRAESVTIDPHKKGYVPYPAGALLFRDERVRDVVSLKAPYLWHGEGEGESGDIFLGPYTLEGTRPGAMAAAVWLAQKVLPLHSEGHGQLILRSVRNAQELYRCLTEMTPVRLKSGHEVYILPITRPDFSIVGFTLNIKGNTRLHLMNHLVEKVYARFASEGRPKQYPWDYFVSMTELGYSEYGDSITDVLFKQAGILPADYNEENERSEATRPGNHMNVIRMTVMHPWSLVRSGEVNFNYIEGFCRALKDFLEEVVPQIVTDEMDTL